MEYKSAFPIIFAITFLAIFFLINGCGYLEKDKIEYQKNVLGNIKIQKQETTNVTNLVFAETDEIYSIIVEDCRTVFYDTTSKIVLVESFLNEFNSVHYQIIVLDALSKSVSHAIKKQKIEKIEFDKIEKKNFKKWVLLN